MTKETLFPLGKVYLSRDVAEVASIIEINKLIEKHHTGDWGEDPFNEESNDWALLDDDELVSIYGTPWADRQIIIVTKADRSQTTVEIRR